MTKKQLLEENICKLNSYDSKLNSYDSKYLL